MTKKSFTVTEEQERQLDQLQVFFNEKTHQKTFNRILEWASKKLLWIN